MCKLLKHIHIQFTHSQITERKCSTVNKYAPKKRTGGFGKIIAIVLVLALLAGIGVLFGPRLLHTCSNCDSFFVGTGYRANLISNALTSLSGNDSKVLCRACAEKNHAVAILAGKSLEEFRIPLFESEGN